MNRNQPPGDTELQNRFNQRGFLAGRNMLGDAYPVMDVSLIWPLPIQLNHSTLTLGAGVANYTVLAKPTVGRHMMILRASLGVLAPAANDSFGVIFRRSLSITTADPNDVVLNAYFGNNGFSIPLVGGGSTLNLFQTLGCKPVYVPAGYECALISTSAAGDTGQLNWITSEFPETQPLTSLLGGY
jgi:hypothetical protein